jgi:hypothetical protein
VTSRILNSSIRRALRILQDSGIWLALFALLVGFPGVLLTKYRREREETKRAAQAEQAKADVALVQPIAEAYFSAHHAEDCPTMDILKAAQALTESAHRVDPWGTPYTLSCKGEDVTVLSAGPNRIPGDEDDLRYPSVP